MMQRTVADLLREEYFLLFPDIKRVLHQLRTDVEHNLLPLALGLKHHERIQIEARVKECDSAVDALRRREESRQFDEGNPGKYTLTSLPDLAGLRGLAFPNPKLAKVLEIVHANYGD